MEAGTFHNCAIGRKKHAKRCSEMVGLHLWSLLGVSIYSCRLTRIGIPMLKIRRSHDRLIFNMGIPIPGKDGLYIETGLRSLHSNTCLVSLVISRLIPEPRRAWYLFQWRAQFMASCISWPWDTYFAWIVPSRNPLIFFLPRYLPL